MPAVATKGHPGRAKGSGFQRRDGTWLVRWLGADGKRHSASGKTAAEARRRAEEKRGEWQPTEKGTFAGFVARWLGEKRATIKPATHRTYEQLLRIHALPVLGARQLSAIGEDDLERLYASMRSSGVGATTTAHVATVLGTALEAARRRKLILENPAHNVRKPRMVHQDKRALSGAEVRRLLEAARGDPLEAFVTIAVTTGARMGEVLALHWRDIDFEQRMVRIRGTVSRAWDGKLVVAAPKTERSRRDVPLTTQAVETLLRLQERSGGAAEELLFPGAKGAPRWQNAVRKGYQQLLVKAGLPPATVHSLRDTAATLMLGQGVPVQTVSAILGHTQVSTTLNIYSHSSHDLERAAAAKLQEVLGR